MTADVPPRGRMRVVVMDPYRLTLDEVRAALEASGDIDVVAGLSRAGDLLAHLKDDRPDLVLLDLDPPDMDGLACLRLVRRNYAEVQVVMLAAEPDPVRIGQALRDGALACVLKAVEPQDLASALRHAVQGTIYTTAPGLDMVAPEAPITADLTDRERTMLQALARGLSNKAIAEELWVTEQTVKFHLGNLYRKLGVANRTAAARFAFDHGLVDGEEPAPGG